MSEEELEEQTEGTTIEGWQNNRRLVIALAVIGVLGLLAAVVFAILLLREPDDEVVEDDTTPVATLVAAPVPTAVAYEAISESGTVTLTVESPAILQIAGREFALRAQAIPADGIWSPIVQGEGTGAWVYGSIINYVIGLPATDSNRNLLEGLTLGDEILLTTRGEREVFFSFNTRNLMPTTNRDIYAQNEPGITLVLMGDGGQNERLVVKGSYVVPDPSSNAPNNVYELGEPAQLETAVLTVNGATYLPGRPEAPTGFEFILVDYQVQNTGLTALDTSLLQMTLLDELGNRYVLNGQASLLGNYPPLSGFINSGQLVQATIGYQIPIGLISRNLNWAVLQTGTNNQIQVTIPFNGSGTGGQGTAVMLDSVAVSEDLTRLGLIGTIINGSTQPLVISEQSVTLRTGDGSNYLLLSTNPPFPWSVAPGQTISFSVSFQRPSGFDNATFTILNQQFELSNLR
jgi:hypothetical protein